MESIKTSGIKQFIIELANFLANLIIMVLIMIISNLVGFDFIEYSKQSVRLLNILLFVAFIFCILIQNIFFQSLFYAVTKYKLKSNISKPRIGILCHNIFFNTIIIGTIVVQVCEVPYLLKVFFMLLLLIDFIPCFIKKYSKSLSCFLFKIETMKSEKPIKNDGIVL